ncbi:efflux transporter outer membrane subunit [Ideonella sp. 4Y11]|uniref:Efflux transporter outer membrane subunit n=1 Tax=Ideonella aquatica TaxID=2824119 RepID=A0A940YJF9_9BURK|nr:efflux transporter outer membrane subunit [Ideonella aquatica]MBQ0958984.1 efflux transporter outer membrane subunit [Ideonella aquatica]
MPLLLAACASVERAATPPDSTAELPARWTATDTDRPVANTALATWWQQLGSAEFNTLAERALTRNTSLRSAQAALRQARALRAASEAATRPSLSLGSQAQRQQADGMGGSTSLSLGFSASWEADLWGAQSLGLAASRADERAAEADLAATRLALLAELGLAWTQWQADLARQQITQASLRSLEHTASLVRWNAQAGLASALDVEQTVQTLESTRASLLALNTQVTQDQHAIAVLTGDGPATPLPEASGSLMDLGWPQLDQALSQLATGQPADLLRRRPDLLSAEAGVQAAWLRRRQTDRAAWPGLALTGTLGLQAATLAGLGQPGAALATLGAAADWTLLDGGRQTAQRDQQDAALEAARARYDAALLSALKDTEDSLVALRGATERQTALRLSAQAAQQAMRLSQARQQAGLINTAALLEAQRTALSTDLSWIAARADQASHLIRTWKSLGGGWDAPAAR